MDFHKVRHVNMLLLNLYLYIYMLLRFRWQVVQETNFDFLKDFLESFAVRFPTAKELEEHLPCLALS